MNEIHNLSRWLYSGEQDYATLLTELRAGPYWPLSEAQVRLTLERATSTYRDLERWGLLAKPDSDDEIFF